MLKNIPIILRVVPLFLMLLGSSNYLFSANQVSLSSQAEKEEQQIGGTFLLGEQVESQGDFILPYHKNLVFFDGSFKPAGDFNSRILDHTTSSLSYIKRSRYIFPTLGVKEVIFPFHVFL